MDLVRRSGSLCGNPLGIHWGRGLMAFCVSLVELKVSAFKEKKWFSFNERTINSYNDRLFSGSE